MAAEQTVGIRLVFARHPDRNPLHWLMAARCPHGEPPSALVVGRREVIVGQQDALALNYRVSTGCDCQVVGFPVAD